MKTAIKYLVEEVNQQIKHDTDITENVFVFIQNSPSYLKRYCDFCEQYHRAIVNRLIGRLVKELNGLENKGQSKAKGTTLISSYTKH
jgi:hypothetical protein